ncbi:MAG: discoidin domain-containing protein [Sedimentisphaerales bacterium]|nr:discoidin domain-containing protein [Sedimentisphaerales bacterium]
MLAPAKRVGSILVVLVCLLAAPVCWAASGVIYSDDLNGSGPLEGSAPDVRPGVETWLAAPVFSADGVVATDRVSGTTYRAWLPFTPDPGQVYVLSLDVDPQTSGANNAGEWFALGFSNSNAVTGDPEFWDSGIAWILHRITRDSADNDEIQTFVGPGMSQSANYPSKESGPVKLTVILDTTESRWTVEWLRNGESIRGPVTYATNPTISQVGFAKIWGAGGTVDNFELKLSDLTAPLASLPRPADKADDVPIDTLLSWRPGVDAVSHDVYLGPVLDDVSNASRANPLDVLASAAQDANTYDPAGSLDYGQTYYWRVDEVDATGAIVTGSVWSFTVEPRSLPILGVTATASNSEVDRGPENTVNRSGLTEQDEHSTAAGDMWQTQLGAAEPVWIQYAFDQIYKLHELKVWNYNGDLEYLVGFGLKDVTIEYSTDGATWTTLGDFTFAQGTSSSDYLANTTVDFGDAVARYVRLTVNSSWGTSSRYGLSEVRFLYIPTFPREPYPASGATDVNPDVVLTWRAGRDAALHDVYLGADEATVETGAALIDAVADNRYPLSGLDLGATYYWKITEVNEAGPVVAWEGPTWNFTTAGAYVVDDFERYNDNETAGLVIWQTWADGFGTTDNGAQVGHSQPPYAEEDIVHRGDQSMPFYYNNSGTFLRSEAVRTFDTPQDWTRSGIETLVLHFQGRADNTTGQLYVKVNDARVVYSGSASDLTKEFWVPWAVDLASVGTDLTNVRSLTIGVENGGSGLLLFDDVGLYRVAPQSAQAEAWIEAEDAYTIDEPMQVYTDREDASGGAYIATIGDNSSGDPPDEGVASFPIALAGGTYRIIGRVIAPTGNDDSFWVRLQGATTNTVNHASGWIRWGLDIGNDWHEVPVRSMDDDDATVLFDVEPGVYNLQIAYREDGALLDNWIVTQQLE